jgi:uncharacterized 2Fe-2S/4Fe-4S cluster protein (DUF4445 family)
VALTRPQIAITLQPLGRAIAVQRGTALRAVLHAYGVEFPCGGRGRCAGCRVKQTVGSLGVTGKQDDILTREEIARGWRLACRCVVESDVTLEVGQWDSVVLADHSAFTFTPHPGLGIAVDLGTTTVVAQLLDMESGQVLAVRTAINPQTVHGSDVMSRIQLATEGGCQAQLVVELRGGIGTLLEMLVASAQRPVPHIDTVVLVGNTVMHHLFCDVDLIPLSRAPFESMDDGPCLFHAADLGWTLGGNPTVRFLPCLGGFVGSDVLAGILATKMHERETLSVLVDLGTNGEIVVGNRHRMLCASTAAGPAFEGGRIAMGMRAITGAISEVGIEDGQLRCRTVGDAPARGVCGSGLVDAVAAGLDLGLIQPSGRLTRPDRPIELVPPVSLSQSDIRQLQLAKAAIAAGLRILQRRFGGDACEAAPLYLAGAFGNYVSRTSARRIGLLDAPVDVVHSAGNTALLGAKIALCANDPGADGFRQVRERIEHVALATDPGFQEAYVNATAFPGYRRPARMR